MPDTYTIQISPIFWDDHMARECTPAIIEQRTSKRRVALTLDDDGLRDLYTDAVYYANGGDFDPHMRGICTAARNVRVAIREQQPDWYAEYRKTPLGREFY